MKMKHFILPAIMLLLGTMAPLSAQTAGSNDEEPVFVQIENKPEFEGGWTAFEAYFQNNLRYPKKAVKERIEGKVLVKFIVEKDGSVSNAEVIRSVSKELDKEALRVIRNMPKWKPGTLKGKPVRCSFTVPVTFRISEE